MAAEIMNTITRLLKILDSDEYQAICSTDQSNIFNDMYDLLVEDVIPEINAFELQKADIVRVENNRQDLVRSRNILRSLFDNLPDMIYIIDRKYEIDAVNMALSRRIGKLPQLLVGKVCYQALYQQNQPCQDCRILKTLQTGIVTTRDRQERGVAKEFSEWEINSYPIYDEKGEVSQIILVERDVTERHRMEMLVAQSEKMAAVGQLAAGFAHEINNPLTVIMANAQILLREIPAENDWHELLQRINTAGGRSLDIVGNLLDFARWESLDIEPTDINLTITKALVLIRHVSKGLNTELVFQPEQDLPIITASAGNLQSVWVNLILNALDAVEPGKGKIVINTFHEDDEIIIKISDNGRGIPADRLSRIFDPFYTTKDPGRGTGLGLSICHRIVKQHGGQIEVDSIEGEGSVFTVRLPDYPIQCIHPGISS